MKIGFILNSPFHILSVFQRPLGDAESSICYLAIELAKLGHDITIFSQTANSIGAFDVRCRSINIDNNTLNLDKAILEDNYDALIVKNNSPEFIISLKQALPHKSKFFLWTSLDYTDPLNQGLSDPQKFAELAGVICVSDWQRTRIIGKLSTNKDKMAVIRYAISPFFENLFCDGKEFINTKVKTPQLAYTAKHLSGLEILIDAFADVQNNYVDATLSIFAGLHHYGAEADKLEKLYQSAAHIKGIKHTGIISQGQLAAQLRTHTILAYPCTIEETSNIAIMEALAAGLYVITSNLGCLPEYTTEHGKCLTEKNLHTETLESFIGQTLAICQTQVHSPSAFYDYCFKQAVDINKNHTWRVRAREWVHMLTIANAS